VVIEQAKGALVAREGLSEREAFERMRRQARRERRPVIDVAVGCGCLVGSPHRESAVDAG
jgi:AmiR/NasT family two-component response regulator